MEDENSQQSPKLSVRMVEPGATERLKKLARDLGLIVNASSGKDVKPTSKKKVAKV